MATLQEHIDKSFKRLQEEDYQIQNVYKPLTYGWQGDWEGRALLAYCNLYQITGKKIPAMDEFIKVYPEKCNSEGFLGNLLDVNVVDEQQLSGHNWLLSGMVEYAKIFNNSDAIAHAKNIFNNLYYKAFTAFDNYPTKRERSDKGAVSGTHTGNVINGWKVSTDVGCAFMCIDGVSRYYELTKDEKAKEFLDMAIEVFYGFDKLEARAQTHTTLTATRGILRLYEVTGDKSYYDKALNVFNLYLEHGMTYTYENFNWFERKGTWTEPCAVIDSLMISSKLYQITKEEKYLTLFRRIWFNGLSFCHRITGGAGTSTTVYSENEYLKINLWEAKFCCTMRYCEGLLCAYLNRELLEVSNDEPVFEDELGRKFKGDRLYVYDEEEDKEILLCDLAFPEQTEKRYRVYQKNK